MCVSMNQKTVIFSLITFTLTLAEEASLQELTNGNNLFTVSVYKELLNIENGNFLISPFSLQTILALTQFGAKEESAKEIITALHLPDDQEKIQTEFKNLQTAFKDDQLQTANKIYIKDSLKIDKKFKEVATTAFDADVENINFLEEKIAAKTMNDWIEQRTNNKIHDLVSSKSLDENTRTLLINALYFKSNWSSHFDSFLTVKKNFYRNNDEVIEVDTMQDSAYYKYLDSSEMDAKFLEIPFEGEQASMIIVLPKHKEGLSSIESQIDKVFNVANSVTFEYVTLNLPKFKVETAINFKNLLQKIGIQKIFKEDEADLSGIAGEKGDLFVNEVLQKTFMNVNEEGVEAAAASAIIIGIPLSGILFANPPKEFIVDHPFLFYIKVNDFIVFMGRVLSPI